MREAVADIFHIVRLGTKAQITLLIEPNLRVFLDQHPLANIELPLQNNEWIFDILLHDILQFLGDAVVQDIRQLHRAFDASTAGQIYNRNSWYS